MRRRAALALTLAAAAAVPRPAGAHGTGARALPRGAVAAYFHYTDGAPMAFAPVEVRAPGGAEPWGPALRTDRHGRVAFVPDRDGTWTLRADDPEGHGAELAVPVEAGAAVAPPLADAGRWLLWGSLLLNVGAAALLLGRRGAAARGGPAPAATGRPA